MSGTLGHQSSVTGMSAQVTNLLLNTASIIPENGYLVDIIIALEELELVEHDLPGLCGKESSILHTAMPTVEIMINRLEEALTMSTDQDRIHLCSIARLHAHDVYLIHQQDFPNWANIPQA